MTIRYRPEIDGLRAVAVVPVILYHAGIGFVRGGFVGVDVFFVISGYLISSLILSDLAAGRFSLLSFYERRVRRILPPLIVVCLASAVVGWRWLLPSDMVLFCRSIVSTALFLSNLNFWREASYFDVDGLTKPLLHTWSLAIEEQFYVVYPVLLLLVWKRRWNLLVIVTCAIGASLATAQALYLAHYPGENFYFLPSRAWELMIGAWVAVRAHRSTSAVVRSRPANELLGVAGLAAIAAAVLFYDDGTRSFPGVAGLLPTLGAAAILLSDPNKTIVGSVLQWAPLRGVGLISYSAYLWHQPLFAFARHRSLVEPGRAELLALAAGSILLGYLSWRFIEKPCRNRSAVSTKRILLLTGVGTTAMIIFGAVGWRSAGLPDRFSGDVTALSEATVVHQTLANADGCNDFTPGGEMRKCIKGRPGVVPRFALAGDSHAAALSNELSHAFDGIGESFVQLTRNGGVVAAALACRCSRNEGEFSDRVLEDAKTNPVQTYILSSMWSWYASDEDFVEDCERCGALRRDPNEKYSAGNVSLTAAPALRRAAVLASYEEAIGRLRQLGKTVVLVYPVPEMGRDIPALAAKQKLFGGNNRALYSVAYSAYLRRSADVLKLFDELEDGPTLIRVRPDTILCNTFVEGRCTAMRGDELLYYDDDHLATAGARLVVERIVQLTRN